MEYHIIFSKRKTASIAVTQQQQVILRAPHGTPREQLEAALQRKLPWVEKQLQRMGNLAQKQSRSPLTKEQILALTALAKQEIPPLVTQYSAQMGCSPTAVTITGARTRWGSCSGKGRLCFSYRVMLLPPDLITYVVLHELTHLFELNHSHRFYTKLGLFLPNHRLLQKELKDW